MNLEEKVQAALHEHTKDWTAPQHIRPHLLQKLATEPRGYRMKKWGMIAIITALLAIPTGVYAGYSYLADYIYGSQDNMLKLGGTQQQYEALEEKLLHSKQYFSEAEFSSFMDILKELGQFYLTYADENGIVHPEQWNEQDQARYKALAAEVEPLLKRLDELEKQASASSMDDVLFWEEALKVAEAQLSQDEFREFNELYQAMWTYKSLVTDADQSLHWDRISKEEQAEVKLKTQKLMRYLERLGYKVE